MADRNPTATNLTEDEMVAILVVHFWNEFERGAAMPVAPDCILEAIAKGAQTNIRNSVNVLFDIPNGDEFVKAMKCCFDTGVKARELETGDTISRANYGRAYDDVAEFMARAIRMHALDGTARMAARICG